MVSETPYFVTIQGFITPYRSKYPAKANPNRELTESSSNLAVTTEV